MKHHNLRSLLCLLAAAAALTACNDWLDMEPVNQITPDDYYKTADQVASYLDNYYNDHLRQPFSGDMFHAGTYTDEMAHSDANTDIMVNGSGNTQLFADGHWLTGKEKDLQEPYAKVRVWNHFIATVERGLDEGAIAGDEALVRNYLGEGRFFRALCYYNLLALYGDVPIVRDVLTDDNDSILAHSARAPRPEVARFILDDLAAAAADLYPRDRYHGQRVSREAALLLRSRVALFEATFERYHKGSGRVPGDAQWPGASMSYNAGKTFDTEANVRYFLTEAMTSAREAVGSVQLTANNHLCAPALGQFKGWNPYFEMYSQLSLSDVDEVILWKQYDFDLGIKHNAAWRCIQGSGDGYTRAFTESFLMKNGLPTYAPQSGYAGDESIDSVKARRDERLQLFLWGESDVWSTDPAEKDSYGQRFGKPGLARSNAETRTITGYQPRKYYTYEYQQRRNDEINGFNACPIFRTAEAMLNYMEACCELTGALDDTAMGYWRQLRARAGITADPAATVAATDMAAEAATGNWAVRSGTTLVQPLLYNIRRERMAELFSEGQRYADLIRWRAFDHMLSQKWAPEGINLWDSEWRLYDDGELVADGSASATVSPRELGKYVRPYSRDLGANNELRDGYSWHEAYYLYPLGLVDITSASPDRNAQTSLMYQNPDWPTDGGARCIR